MKGRARLLAVVSILAMGAVGLISSTQTWLSVMLADGVDHEVVVTGADAVPVLAPLSLAVLALGAALSIVGLVLRFAFGVLTVLIGGLLGYLSAVIAFAAPAAAVASSVTAATGITGTDAVADLVSSIRATPWPSVTLATCLVLVLTGAFTLVTAAAWRGSGRKYEADNPRRAVPRSGAGVVAPASGTFDAVDSWDDLSRGGDPTADAAPDAAADPTTGPR